MKVKLWGVRGSIPTPIVSANIEDKLTRVLHRVTPADIASPDTIDTFIKSLPVSLRGTYGGNTTCIEVVTDSGDIFIFDAGSGLKNCGLDLLGRGFGGGKGHASIVMTHTHWDHIQGLPFFVPLFIKGNSFNFYSAIPDLEERLRHQQVESHFPKDLDYMAATKKFFCIPTDDDFYVNNSRLFMKTMPHPGGAYGIRLEDQGKVVVYTSDCEFNIESVDLIDTFRALFENANLVLFDTQYTFEESFDKYDWGHSSASIAIDIAGRFNVDKLVLFHHDPDYDDLKLERVLFNARSYLRMNRKMTGKLKVELAIEGKEYLL